MSELPGGSTRSASAEVPTRLQGVLKGRECSFVLLTKDGMWFQLLLPLPSCPSIKSGFD